MHRIILNDVPPYDGGYELELVFSHSELHRIKKMTGLRAGELFDAFNAGDSDVMIAFAVIALERDGKDVDDDLLWNAPVGGITFVSDTDEEDNSPPAPAASPGSSGDATPQSSENPANGQSPTGSPLSDIGAAYAHPT